ncbi:MAG: LapA family protein [Xanthomonadales bacterium]|nr:LapA family protein [Xanthomonadales bacterium]
MTRLVFGLIALLAIITGLLVGTLNSDPVTLDLLWVNLDWPLGLLVLLFFSSGLALGLALMFVIRVLPLRLKLRKARAVEQAPEPRDIAVSDD